MGGGGEVVGGGGRRGEGEGKIGERGGREKEEKFARAMRKEEGESGKTKTAAKGDHGLSERWSTLVTLGLLHLSHLIHDPPPPPPPPK